MRCVVRNLKQAGRETKSGSSPERLFGELVELPKYHILDNWQSYVGKITPQTRAVYCRAENADKDDSVLVDKAYLELQKFFDKFGVPLEHISVPNSGHAQTELTLPAAAGWLERTKDFAG